MNCKRIGKDVRISLDLLIDEQIQSLDYGKLTMSVRDKFGARYILDHKLETNKITAVFPGKQQYALGIYSISIEYDYNGEKLFFDYSDAFELVKSTEEEIIDEEARYGIFTHQITAKSISVL